jgi:hypothetical protein
MKRRVQTKNSPERVSAASRWWEGFLCGVVVVGAIWLSHPYAEMGFIDDWSYVKTAFEYARTGHFVYNGWATAMLGWQVPWGALFVRLFGYSFTAARLSMLPIDLASVWLFYSILVRFGIERRNAVFGTLTLGLSPLFIPLGASYMTDIPGLFAILLCLYLCVRAVAAEWDRTALLWLALAAASNVAGGTVRQIAWLGALVMVPSTAWLMRRRQHAVITGAVLWVASAAAILACLGWWNRQPYSVPERIVQGPVSAAMVAHLGAELLKALLCTCLLLLPVLLAWLPRYRTLPARMRLALPILVLALAATAYALHLKRDLHFWTMPWLVHVIGSEGIFQFNWDMIGSRPVTITVWLQAAISIAVIAVTAVFTISVCREPVRWTPLESNRSNQLRWLVGPFAVAYISLLISRGLYIFIYDRYLLGLLPLAVLGVLRLMQQSGLRLPSISYAALALFGIYGVLATHDLFALNRARIAAVQEVRASGIPADMVQAGFEFDGWTELELAGHVNEKRIETPPDAYVNDTRYLLRPQPCRLGYDEYTPALNRAYLVALADAPCGVQSAFNSVEYRAWLPPFRRSVYIRKVPQLPAR